MPTFNDIGVPYGSQLVTIGATGYVCETISYEQTSTPIERRNEVGEPKDQVFIVNFDTGTAVLQLDTSATVVPAIGATFTMALNGGGTAGVAIHSVGQPFAQMEARKLNIGLRRRYQS